MSATRAVAVFGSSMCEQGMPDWAEANQVGARLARAGLAVITGGYGGTMEAASMGAAEAGGHVIGVTAPSLFPGRSGANPYVAELIEATSLTNRLGTMFEKASGTIALPGSIGTATELLIAWNTNHIVRRSGGAPLPSVAVGDVWRELSRTLVDGTGAVGADIHLAGTGEEAVEWILPRLEKL